MQEIIKQWREHIDFPIYMSTRLPLSQFKVNDFDEFLSHALSNIDQDLFVSVHDVENRSQMRFNKVFFDLDNDVLTKAFSDLKRFVNVLKKRNYTYRTYFTRGKGFHVYIDFPWTIIEDYSDRISSFIRAIKIMTEIKTKDGPTDHITSFDMGVCKDKNRISRLIWSIHTKHKQMMIPIDVDMFDLENPKAVAQKRVPSENFIKDYMRIKIVKDQAVEHVANKGDATAQVQYLLTNAEKVNQGCRNNLVWKILVPTMVKLNYSDDDIINDIGIFYKKAFGEFDKKQWVRNIIKRTRKVGYSPMSMSRFIHENGDVFNE